MERSEEKSLNIFKCRTEVAYSPKPILDMGHCRRLRVIEITVYVDRGMKGGR